MKKLEFLQVPGFAIWGLHLKGNELLCFSLVYSLSHSKSGYFVGTQDDVAELLNISKRSAAEALTKLEDKGLIDKSVVWTEEQMAKTSILTTKVQNLHFTNDQSAESAFTKVQNLQHPPILSTNNNINNTNNNTPFYPPRKTFPKDQENAKAETLPPVPPTPLPFGSAKFIELWGVLCKMPKWRKKEQYALNLSLKKLGKYSEAIAIRALEDAIENGWQGVFPDKVQKEERVNQPRQPYQSTEHERVVDIKDVL